MARLGAGCQAGRWRAGSVGAGLGLRAALCIALASGISLTCGSRLPPPGGLEDTLPPTLIAAEPKAGATGVPLDGEVCLIFSERIAEEGARTAVELSPLAGPLAVHVDGEEIRLRARGGLRPGTTYEVRLLPRLADLRGNRLTARETWAFSTGEALAAGSISGTLTGPAGPAGGARAEAWLLPDSLRYWARADSSGSYSLRGLLPGRYGVRAYMDRDGDDRLTPFVDEGADTSVDVGEAALVVPLTLTVADSSPARLQEATALDSLHIRLFFDDPLSPETSEEAVVRVTEAADTTLALPVAGVGAAAGEARALVITLGEPLRPGADYQITARGVRNQAGLPLRGTAAATVRRPEPEAP